MNSNDSITKMLLLILMFAIIILFCLIVVLIFLRLKTRNKKDKEKIETTKAKSDASKISQEYNIQSIFKFMEFDTVQDSMIVQKKGKRFLMVIQCQGVNYDLMSQMEKVSVEEGFLAFLNTLRHPIQLYVQTRTINLESSLMTYRARIKEIEDKLNNMKAQYELMKKSNQYSQEELERAYFEITKQNNLYEYGKDVIYNTEKLSQNKNILNKNYYIIVPHYPEEANDNKYDAEEVQNIAFSELYTKSQSIIRTLAATGVNGKILDSNELAELLYIAYNRDDAEIFNLRNAISSGCEDMYTTGKDVFDKKVETLDKEIEKRAFELAKESIEKAKVQTQKEKEAKEKEENMQNLINMMADMMLENNKQYIGEEITKKAQKIVKTSTKEGEDENVQKQTKRTRTTRTKKNS